MTTKVLILCTHNSARSVLAEGMLNHWANRLDCDVVGYSAGSAPSGQINPFALQTLNNAGVDTTDFRSKSWDEFVGANAPLMRIVITVCDAAAAHACPYWPNGPISVHWGYPDPFQAPENERAAAFELTRQAIAYRMLQLLQLPVGKMSDAELRTGLSAIGNT